MPYGQDVPLEMIDTPDRRITRAAAELAVKEAEPDGTHVTVVLPRRSFSPLLGRLLHDRTADQLAAVVSRVPSCAATIIPFDVDTRVAELHARHTAAAVPTGAPGPRAPGTPGPLGPLDPLASLNPGGSVLGASGGGEHEAAVAAGKKADGPDVARTGRCQSAAAPPLRRVGDRRPGDGRAKVIVEGRVRSVEIRPVEQNCVFEATVADDTGALTARFYGRTGIPGIGPGARGPPDGKVSTSVRRPRHDQPGL